MKHYILAAVAAVLLLGVAPVAPPSPGDAGIYETRLANGLRVLVVEDASVPVVQTGVWYRFGSINEPVGDYGLAHALEHMMFRGTTDLSSGGLDDLVARLGAQMNATTSYDYTHFYFVVPADKVNVALGIEADRMSRLALAPSQWKIEQRAVLNELDGDASSPILNLLSRVRAAAYPNLPLGRTPIGLRSDVARATTTQLRSLYTTWYRPGNATLVISGDVRHDAVFALARKYFAAIPAGVTPAHPAIDTTAHIGATVEAEFPSPFEILDLAYAVPGDSQAGEPAISTLATFINNQNAPFYQSLVASNVALAVQANADTQVQGGLLHVFIVLNPGHSADVAQTIFQSQMNSIIANGIPPELAHDAKRMTIAQRLYSADSIDGLEYLAGYTYGIIGEKVSDEDHRLAALTEADLQAAAKRWLSRPTVVGHLRPNETPPKSTSNKSTANATDSFGGREPKGPIMIPAWMKTAAMQPTTARSVLAPIRFTLPNGLHVLFQRKADRPTFTLQGKITTLPSFEPPGQKGIAQLASSVANYGSKAYSFARRRSLVDGMGAYLSTGSSFSITGTPDHFAQLLTILADGELHPTFAEPWFSLERGQLANTVDSENHLAGVLAQRAYLRILLQPGDPTLREVTHDHAMALTRSDLLDYTHRYWRPDLTTIVIVGDLDIATVKKDLTTAFGDWRNDGPKPNLAELPLAAAHSASAWIQTDANQVTVELGMPGISSADRDYDAARLLVQILGGPGVFESRLFQNLRQRTGLVYSVSADLSSNQRRGDLSITFATGPERVARAIALVREQLRNLQAHPVSQRELDDARQRLVVTALLDEASADGQAEQLMHLANNGLSANYYQTLGARLAHITPADLQRVAKRILQPDRLAQVFTGPRGYWSDGQ